MKKSILCSLSLVGILLVLCACGATKPAESESETSAPETGTWEYFGDAETQTQFPTEESFPVPEKDTDKMELTTPTPEQTGTLFQKFVEERIRSGRYTIRFRSAGVTVVTTVDGDDSVLESDATGLLRFSLIHKDGRYFMLSHTTKKYAEITAEDYKDKASSLQMGDMDFGDMQFLSSGEETISGKKYSTETYDEGTRGVVTYFFDETGLRRSKVKKDGKTNVVDTLEVLNEADAKAFRIPDGYKLVSDPGALFVQ